MKVVIGILVTNREKQYHPAVSALIPVDVCMGIPVIQEGHIMQIPFYRPLGGQEYLLAAWLCVEYPSGEICGYQKVRDAVPEYFGETELREKKRLFMEDTGNDKYTAGIRSI